MNEAFDKILDRLIIMRDKYSKDTTYGKNHISAYNKALKIVQEVAEEYNGGWIACSERLPEESLNSVIGWDEYRQRCCFVQYYGGRWILGNDIDSVKIIAWQPLPEPFKERD